MKYLELKDFILKIFINSCVMLMSLMYCNKTSFSQESYAHLIKQIQPAVVTVITLDALAKPKGLGSGFFIDDKGCLITNYHVIEDASMVAIKTADGSVYKVKGVMAEDRNADIAILSVDIPGNKIHHLKIKSITPEAGDRVIVLGSPLGLDPSSTVSFLKYSDIK